jgi:hypothetical protein
MLVALTFGLAVLQTGGATDEGPSIVYDVELPLPIEAVVRKRYYQLVGGPEDKSFLQVHDRRTLNPIPKKIQKEVFDYLNGLENSAKEEGVDVSAPILESWKSGEFSGLINESSRDLLTILAQNEEEQEIRVYNFIEGSRKVKNWEVWDRRAKAIAQVSSSPDMPVRISLWKKTAERWPGFHFRADPMLVGVLNWIGRSRNAGAEVNEAIEGSSTFFTISVALDPFSEDMVDLEGLVLHWMSPLACRRVEVKIEANEADNVFSLVVLQLDNQGRPLMIYGWRGIGEESMMQKSWVYQIYLPGTDFVLIDQTKSYSSGSDIQELLGFTPQLPSLAGLNAEDRRGSTNTPMSFILQERIPVQL